MENKELPKNYIDGKTGIEYSLVGDYYIPNLVLPDRKNVKLGKYGRMRARYLKENKKAEYTIMLMNGTLRKHIVQIDIDAKNRVENIVNSLKSQSDLTEEMKNFDPLYWVGMMNNFKNQAEEIVLKELIYV